MKRILFLFFLNILKSLRHLAERGINYIESASFGRFRIASSREYERSGESLKKYRLYPFYADISAVVILLVESWFFNLEIISFISTAAYTMGIYLVFANSIRFILEDDILSEPSVYLLTVFLFVLNNFIFLLSRVYSVEYLFLSSGIIFMSVLLMPRRLPFVFAVFSQIIILPFYKFAGGGILPLFPAMLMSSSVVAAILLLSPPVSSRVAVISGGVKISAANTAVFAFMREIFASDKDIVSGGFTGIEIYYALLSGAVAAGFILIFLPIVEMIFKRLSPISLVEMSDINKPLLKQMMVSAPGTYHHSLITASLAEAAAESIGASGALARVGAYYHDIGKLFKPEYFIENQIYSGNPHDDVTPTMSGMVLMAHVKEGVDLARRHNLNPRIIDFIEEHHGTSLIIQFYHKAIIKDINVNEKDFRYEGSRPRSRETAVVMLADSVEAASRSLPVLKPVAISDMVKKVVNNKFVDGQLNDSPLTLKDIEVITDTMIRVLCGILHVRYQKQRSQEEQGDTDTAAGDSKSEKDDAPGSDKG